MSKLSIYVRIQNFLRSLSNEKKTEIDNGYQLCESDLGAYLNNFLSKKQKELMLKNINSTGYLPSKIADDLKSYINNPDYTLYIKSVHGSFVESIFNEGIRCYGNTSVLATTNPKSIKEISLENTITKMDLFPMLISNIKSNNGQSQGFMSINGTLILLIPKNMSNDEILYFNEASNTYNIKPVYIVGFIPVDQKGNVKDWIFNELFGQENSYKK